VGRVIEDLLETPHFQFVPFTPSHVLDFLKDDDIPEMHDRMIAGLATRLRSPLLTHDQKIVAPDTVRVGW